MLSTRFVLLAALISASLGRTVPQNTPRRRSAPPEGFAVVSAAPQGETITFRISLPQKSFPGLEKALYAASTPGSKQFGQYLTKDQVKDFAGPSEDAVASVSSWLEEHGLSASSLSPSGDWISVEATVAQANKLLQADFKSYEAKGTDAPVIRTLSYELPPQVKDHIVVVHPTMTSPALSADGSEGVRNVTLQAPIVHTDALSPRQEDNPDLPLSCRRPTPEEEESMDQIAFTRAYTLGCKMDMYQIPYAPLTAPVKGNSLWISGYNNNFASHSVTRVGHLDIWRPDFNGEREMFRLVTITGGKNSQLPIGSSRFAVGQVVDLNHYFDSPVYILAHVGSLSGLMTIAPNTPVTFMSVGTDKSDDYMVWLIDQANCVLALDEPPKVLVITGSAIGSEVFVDPELTRSLCNTYAQLSARGVTVLVPVKQGGRWGNDYTCPLFDVSVTSVWDTFPSNDPDNLWEESEENAGGFSQFFDRPAYQEDAVKNAPNSEWGFVAITFAATYLGEIIALLNEELINAGKPTMGFINPLIYQNLDAFKDITLGKAPTCGTPGFNATGGWDPLSGVGSPFYPELREIAGLLRVCKRTRI
ncbi:Pro-kumamolisin, activation domain-containing protein, partial [Pterulicium gracile]